MYWQKIIPVRAQARLPLLRRRPLRHKHKQTRHRYQHQPTRVIHINATTAATIVVTTVGTIDLSAIAVPASAAHGIREADGASATMMARAGAQVQASDHGVTGIEDIMTADPVDHGTAVEAAVSASAAMTSLTGTLTEATAADQGSHHGTTGAVDIMIGAQIFVGPGTAMEAGWASAGNHLYRKSPALQGFFCLLERLCASLTKIELGGLPLFLITPTPYQEHS